MRHFPARAKFMAYAQLMRLDRPIGTWLLLWPTLWAVWIAGAGHPAGSIVVIFIIGTMLMRAAGCVINDIADRHIDHLVARTRLRPLASGKISVREALMLFVVLLLAAASLLIWLNPLSWLLAIIAAGMASLYPFTKRWTYWPQIIFAFTWSMGILMAFAAQHQPLSFIAWLIYFTHVLWSFMYDTEYAMADRPEDLQAGIKSSAIALGKYDVLGLGILQAVVTLLLILLGVYLKFHFVYFASVIIAIGLFSYQFFLIRQREPSRCFQAFLNNRWIGLAIFIGIVLQYAI